MAEPFYSDDLVTLFHGDCREVPQWLDADVLVTDPPYGMAYISNAAKAGPSRAIAGDSDTTVRDAALKAWGPERPALVFGRWDRPRPAGTRARLVWDKGDSPGMGDLRLPWGRTDEEVYVLGTWPPVKPGGRRREGGTPSRSASVIRVVQGSTNAQRGGHPTPKPVALMEKLVAKCPPGIVADPFAGSGSTLLAAASLGRPSVGVEVDEAYCEVIAERLSRMVREPMLPTA